MKKIIMKKVLKESIFGALFTLWTVPIDGEKLSLSAVEKHPKPIKNWFPNNLIIGQRP